MAISKKESIRQSKVSLVLPDSRRSTSDERKRDLRCYWRQEKGEILARLIIHIGPQKIQWSLVIN